MNTIRSKNELKNIVEGTVIEHLPTLLQNLPDIQKPSMKLKEEAAQKLWKVVMERLHGQHKGTPISYLHVAKKHQLPEKRIYRVCTGKSYQGN